MSQIRVDCLPLWRAIAALDETSLRTLRMALATWGQRGSTGFAGRPLWRALELMTRGDEKAFVAHLTGGSPDQLRRVARSAAEVSKHTAADGRHQSAAVWHALMSVASATRDEMLADREHAPSTNQDAGWSAIVEGFGAAPELSTCEPDDTIDPPMPPEEWDAIQKQLRAVFAARRSD